MTSPSTIQFISQVKLGELRRQRSLLLEAYDRISQECAAKPPVEGLKTLFDGLKNIKVAGKPLHRDLGNIKLLLQGAAPSAEIVQFWRRRLETELATGRFRADIVYLFGALLGEWGDEGESRKSFLEMRRQAQEALLKQSMTPKGEAGQRAESLLREIFAGFGDLLQNIPRRIAEEIARFLELGNNAVTNLPALAEDIYQPPDIRKEAKRFLEDSVLHTQYEDAIRVVTRDLRNWNWPSEGVAVRVLWTRNKWRLYLRLSLVELSVLSSFGHFWSEAIESCFSDAARRINRLARYHKLLKLNAPDVILENERRMVDDQMARVDFGWYEPVDPWDGTSTIPAEEVVAGVLSRRAGEQAGLREPRGGGYYDAYGSNRMVSLVHAEVRSLRAAFPERPLFLAKLDIRDYFASIPHSVLLAMLRGLGLSDDGLEAIRRYLTVPYLVDGSIRTAQCGVPMGQDLSHWLAEWLLRLMERYVHGCARVRIIRQIDDVCLLSPNAEDIVAGWRAVHRFLEACSLDMNPDKCGACALGAELPPELPSARPRWGLLEFTVGDDWGVHEPTFKTFCEETREHISAKHALLAKVTMYNAHLRFLASALGLALDLGDGHRRSINDAIRRFDTEFGGPGVGIVAHLRNSIGERYLEATQLSHLPEGWMYSPITAGGLSLRSAFILCGQYQQAFEERKEKRVPVPLDRSANWQHGDTKWSAFYDDQLTNLEPARPKESKVMKALVEDFIARGKEISGGKQEDLSDYWRWVLCIYGPEVLDKFGTFRFLLTDLVPLQLIHEQLLHDSSLEE